MNVEKIRVDNFEVAEEKDYIDVSYILASSVPNGNGALFTKDELEKAKDTIIHQPLIIVPDWDSLPTGHSLEEFPKLNFDAIVVGTHVSSELTEDEDISHLKTTARVWKIRYPEIADKIMSLYEAGNLSFSLESSFKSQTIEGSVRTLHGVRFIGSAIVDNPANPFSYALEVARKRQKEEKVVNFEQAMEKVKGLDADSYVIVSEEFSKLKKEIEEKDDIEVTNDELKKSLENANGKIDKLNATIKEMEKDKEKAELEEKQEERFEEISQYIDFDKNEVASKKEAYGKMDEDTWSIVLETAKRNRKEDDSKIEFASDTKLDVHNGFLDGLGE